jgi:hypothetical protein
MQNRQLLRCKLVSLGADDWRDCRRSPPSRPMALNVRFLAEPESQLLTRMADHYPQPPARVYEGAVNAWCQKNACTSDTMQRLTDQIMAHVEGVPVGRGVAANGLLHPGNRRRGSQCGEEQVGYGPRRPFALIRHRHAISSQMRYFQLFRARHLRLFRTRLARIAQSPFAVVLSASACPALRTFPFRSRVARDDLLVCAISSCYLCYY